MNAQVRAIAHTDRFLELYNRGWTRTQLAKHYGCSVTLINNVVDYLSLRPFNANDAAPSEEEETFSRENLALAPSVYEASEPYRKRYMERKDSETEIMTYNRNYRWRNGL